MTITGRDRDRLGRFAKDSGTSRPAGGLLIDDQIADAVVWATSQPSGVDVNTAIVRPIGQPG